MTNDVLYAKIENVHLKDFDYISIPDAILTYHRDILFSSWQALELQLSQVNSVTDPEVYHALDSRATILFSAWLQFRNTGREY